MNVAIFHNIRWSKYKARIFSCLHALADSNGEAFDFFQIADTDTDQSALSGVDLSYHQYPHTLVFAGSYRDVPVVRRVAKLSTLVFSHKASLIVLPGYDRIEHWAMLLAGILSRKKRALFCDSTINDRPQTLAKGLLKRLFFSMCHGFFAYGARSKEYLEHYGVGSAAIFSPCQAAALPRKYSASLALADRLKFAPPQEKPRYLYVGRLSPEKGLEVLLHAFSEVKCHFPAATLVLVGAGPQREDLVRLVEAIGIVDSIEFVGSLGPEDLALRYGQATCLVLPSISEPWGLVVNEALHYCCPVVVSSKCGCVPELVEHGVSGYAFKSGDLGDLVAKLIMAPSAFANIELTARNCLAVIGPYSAEKAAEVIWRGCTEIVLSRRWLPARSE